MEERAIDSFRLHLGSQTAMHKPLLKPDSLQRARRNFTQQRGDVWPTKSSEADLRRIAVVGVSLVKGSAESGKDQEAWK